MTKILLNNHNRSKSSFFVEKFNSDFPRKVVEVFWVKTRENAAVLDFIAVDNFNFTRKIVKKNWVKNSSVGDVHFLVVDNFDFPR